MADILQSFSDEQLRKELERRDKEQRRADKPQLIEYPDTTYLLSLCQSYIDDLEKKGWADDDLKDYIYEAAMSAFFGEDVFDWINAQRP